MSEINGKKRDSVYEKTGGKCWYCGVVLFTEVPERIKTPTISEDYELPNGERITLKRGGIYKFSSLGKLQRQRSFCVEHVVPKKRGGPDDIDNLVPSCYRCNAQKGTKNLEEFRQYFAWKSIVGHVFSFEEIESLRNIGAHIPEVTAYFYGELT